MTHAEIENLLKEAGVKTSPVRILIAKAISDASGPVSGLDIECTLATVDRSSITRALSPVRRLRTCTYYRRWIRLGQI